MIHVLHGENTAKSRQELIALKEKFNNKEIISIDGKTATLTDLEQALFSDSLFQSEKLVIIEQLLGKNFGRGKENKPLAAWISSLDQEKEVIFWEEKELGKTVQSLFPKKTDFALFKPDKHVFQFVESLSSKNGKIMLEKFQKAVQFDEPELIFALIIRQMRLLIMLKDGAPTGLAPWQLAKLKGQVATFEFEQLLKSYAKLLDIDIRIKTGGTPFSLTQEIESWLMEL